MKSFVVDDESLIQIYIEYVMNLSQYTSKLFSLNNAETKLKFHGLQPITNYVVSSKLEDNYNNVDILFRQFQYFTELLAQHNFSLMFDESEIYVYLTKKNDPIMVIGTSLIISNTTSSSVDFYHSIGQYGNLFLSLIDEKYSLPLNKTKQRQILDVIKCTPLYFALQRCIHPNKKERKILMI